VEAISDRRGSLDESHKAVLTVMSCQPERFRLTGEDVVHRPVQDLRRGQVVPAPQELTNGVELGRELDDPLELGHSRWIPDLPVSDTEGVQSTKAEVVDPELVGKRERFLTELDCELGPTREHLVARTLIDDCG
jgi:hypothetical protein